MWLVVLRWKQKGYPLHILLSFFFGMLQLAEQFTVAPMLVPSATEDTQNRKQSTSILPALSDSDRRVFMVSRCAV